MSTFNLISPSGGRFTVEVPSAKQHVTLGATIRFAGGVYGRAFMIGAPGYHNFACQNLLGAPTRDRFRVHGREVRIATSTDGDTTVATFLGTFHELMTTFTGPAPSVDVIRALFSTLKIKDRPDGMVVQTVSAALLAPSSEALTLTVRDSGSITVPGIDFVRTSMPRHRGAAGRRAEVWRGLTPGRRGTQASDYTYLLGFPTAAAEVSLVDSPDADADLMAWLDGINVSYQGRSR